VITDGAYVLHAHRIGDGHIGAIIHGHKVNVVVVGIFQGILCKTAAVIVMSVFLGCLENDFFNFSVLGADLKLAQGSVGI
jgi:hypothetical protein